MAHDLEPIGTFESIEWIDSTGSTNADLTRRVRDGERRPCILITDEQTQGRGRRDRTWEMPIGGGILASFFVPLTRHEILPLVAMELAVATVDAIDVTGRTVGLKWPNDVVATDGRKVGGLLGEVVAIEGELIGSVIGLGLNVHWPPAGTVEPPNAVALHDLGTVRIDRRALAAGIIARFDVGLASLEVDGEAHTLERYRERCHTLGSDVRVETETESVVGRATGIDPTGALIVDVEGEERSFTAADVIHLRPGEMTPE